MAKKDGSTFSRARQSLNCLSKCTATGIPTQTFLRSRRPIVSHASCLPRTIGPTRSLLSAIWRPLNSGKPRLTLAFQAARSCIRMIRYRPRSKEAPPKLVTNSFSPEIPASKVPLPASAATRLSTGNFCRNVSNNAPFPLDNCCFRLHPDEYVHRLRLVSPQGSPVFRRQSQAKCFCSRGSCV